MKQPSRVDWIEVGLVGLMIAAALGAALLVYGFVTQPEEPPPPPPTAGLEISIEDMERIASMFAGEARRVKDARLDALEARIEKLEEESE